MGSSTVVHKRYSRGQSMLVKVKDDNGFQDVPLTSWPIKIALNSDQIQLAIMRNASPHHHRPTAEWNGFLDVAGGIWLPPHSSSISEVQKKAAFIQPMNLPPQFKNPSMAYLTSCQTCCCVCWFQKERFDRPPGSVPNSLQPIPCGFSLKWTCWESSYLSRSCCWKRGNVEQVVTAPCHLVEMSYEVVVNDS